jgi:glycosyltransferase involved in cell wall biosynthesis
MKVLFIQNRPLFPADTGGKIRTLNVLRHFARWHDVTYLCNAAPGEMSSVAQMEHLGLRVRAIPRVSIRRGTARFWFRAATNLMSRQPLSILNHFDPAVSRAAWAILDEAPHDLVICDFLHTARHAAGLRDRAATVLFQHNVEAQILARHAQGDDGLLRRAYMRMQWRRTHRFERAAGRMFDAVIAVSDEDRATFAREYGWPHVHVIDTAVDLEHFAPEPEPDASSSPPRCVFVGSLDWLPNHDGVVRFVRDVWPIVRGRCPDAVFSIVGRNPSPALRRLGENPGVEVVGTVPDVRPHLAAAAAVVVPLHVGGGTRLKIFAAMAMSKAVVSTSLGAEGLPVGHDRHLLIADDPSRFADAVLRLFHDAALRHRLGTAARALVSQHFGSEPVARQFERICAHAVDARARRRGDERERDLGDAPIAHVVAVD